ncbi:F-box domain containing protein [Trema orientale]|uniref:F-box domain containing protein n=1 Tax=Trema orientale TaxID=63057 RepID=A0A2P5FCL2_TREOI|nr:F-box domain containing protein [Trema orientale]
MESNDENENNRNRCENEVQLGISLGGIPSEVFFDILSRLPLTSLLQCKLVSQLYCSSVKHPLAISMHLSRANLNNPFLICFSDYPISKLDIVDLSSPGNDVFSVRTPNFPLASIFGFGFHPKTKEYKAIKIVYYTEGSNIFTAAIKETEVYILTLGDSEWRHIVQKPLKLITCPASDALVNGNLHWLTMSYQIGEEILRDIISFDLATEDFQVISQPIRLGPNKFLTHLVTLNDCLSAVISSQFGENEIWVLKDYNVKESWTKELVIPDHVPLGFTMNCAPPTRIRLNGTRKRAFRVLCSLKGGEEILFSYRDRCFASFNPSRGEFKDIQIEGLPVEFETIVHVGSLVSVDAAFAGHPAQHHLVV